MRWRARGRAVSPHLGVANYVRSYLQPGRFFGPSVDRCSNRGVHPHVEGGGPHRVGVRCRRPVRCAVSLALCHGCERDAGPGIQSAALREKGSTRARPPLPGTGNTCPVYPRS